MKHLLWKKMLLSFFLCSILLVQSLTSVSATVITPDEADSQIVNTESEYLPVEEPDSQISIYSTETGADIADEKTPEIDSEEIIVEAGELKLDAEDTIMDGYRIRTITPGECPYTSVVVKDSPDSAGVTQTYPNITEVLRALLTEARTQATDKLPTKIVIAPGTYIQSSVLRIYSNTYLSMRGVTIINVNSANMLVTGTTEDEVQSGYCYRNITIDGSDTDFYNKFFRSLYGDVAAGCTWNKNYREQSTAIKVGHAENFTMKNCTLMNTRNAHFMEVTGINNFTLQDCTFKNQILETTASPLTYEAVQFDVLVPEHISGFSYELLKSQNINIDHCTFTNVARGIGSHNAILNFPLENISITNCTFTNLTSSAVQGMDWRNCTISGNYMSNVPRGVTLHSMRQNSIYLPSTIAANSGTPSSLPDTYVAPDLKQNIVITNNTISCSGTDSYVSDYDCSGILLWGITSDGSAPSAGDILPVGNYYISGVTITNNQIKAASGIVLRDVYNATLSSNTLSCPSATEINSYGILTQYGCQNLTFSGNTIKYFPTAGIFCQVGDNYKITNNSLEPLGDGIVLQWIDNADITGNIVNNMGVDNPGCGGIRIQYNSTVNTIDNNKVYNYLGTAALISGGSSVVSFCQNTIEGCRYYGIYLADASVSKIEGNTLATCGFSSNTESYAALTVGAGGKVTSIKNNTIKDSRQAGIQIVQGEAATVSNNTITSPTGYGIELNQGTVHDINSNTIKNAGNYSIVIYNNASISEVNQNTIASGAAIGIHIASTAGALTVDSNTIKNCKTAQIFVNRGKDLQAVTLSNNKIVGSTKTEEGIRIDSGNVVISNNTLKTCRYAVLFKNKDSVTGTIYPNIFTKNKYNSVRYDGISYKNLAAPASVKAVAISKKQIQLKWSASKKISGYLISRSTKKKSGYKQIGKVSYKKTTYLSKKLKKNTKYYYTITAYRTTTDGNLTFYSDSSKVVSKKTLKK